MTDSLQCPIPTCSEVVEIPEVDEVDPTLPVIVFTKDGLPPTYADVRAAQHYAATDALVMAHFEVCHTIGEFAEALGTARNALQDIHGRLNSDPNWSSKSRVDEAREVLDHLCHVGLGQAQ